MRAFFLDTESSEQTKSMHQRRRGLEVEKEKYIEKVQEREIEEESKRKAEISFIVFELIIISYVLSINI